MDGSQGSSNSIQQSVNDFHSTMGLLFTAQRRDALRQVN
jgi:hypothetical protein